MENGIDTGYYDCRFNSQVECESAVQVSEEDDEYTYECRYLEANNVVSESYVVFTVTPEMASANPGMTAGIYELKGGNGGVAYMNNRAVLLSAFGSVNCNDHTSSLYCTVSDLGAAAWNDGHVQRSDTIYCFCQVSNNGRSYCVGQ